MLPTSSAGFDPEPLPHCDAFIDFGDGQAASVDKYRAPVEDDDLLAVQWKDAWTTAKPGSASSTVPVDVWPVVIGAAPAHQSSKGLRLYLRAVQDGLTPVVELPFPLLRDLLTVELDRCSRQSFPRSVEFRLKVGRGNDGHDRDDRK